MVVRRDLCMCSRFVWSCVLTREYVNHPICGNYATYSRRIMPAPADASPLISIPPPPSRDTRLPAPGTCAPGSLRTPACTPNPCTVIGYWTSGALQVARVSRKLDAPFAPHGGAYLMVRLWSILHVTHSAFISNFTWRSNEENLSALSYQISNTSRHQGDHTILIIYRCMEEHNISSCPLTTKSAI